MKAKDVVEINVTGCAGTGKSTLCFAISKFLSDNGFDVQIRLVSDQNYGLEWVLRNEARLKEIRKNICIEVKECQNSL